MPSAFVAYWLRFYKKKIFDRVGDSSPAYYLSSDLRVDVYAAIVDYYSTASSAGLITFKLFSLDDFFFIFLTFVIVV